MLQEYKAVGGNFAESVIDLRNTFTFPIYSHSLKSVLGFNQRQVTLLGVANDVGENTGLLPGIACNRPPATVFQIRLE
ncbi:hypothetical protein KIW84_056018 [Lathyrus oleraceus]|uniref:Nodulin-like domain-containing protein n=1 Tax=Pisum sativum TaxID=3888 RepID=A0A9D4WX25_PEA|nr:hypothetical protein KIW84_056018 [Pisum sativum]